MCKCRPEIKTPYCGKGDCVWPHKKKKKVQEQCLSCKEYFDHLIEVTSHPEYFDGRYCEECNPWNIEKNVEVYNKKYTDEQVEGIKIAEKRLLEIADNMRNDLGDNHAATALEVAVEGLKNLYLREHLEKAIQKD